MPRQTFNNGIHHHYYTQQDMSLETRSERTTLAHTPSEKKYLEKRAAERGYSQLGVYLRHLIKIGLKFEQHLNKTLDEIVP